MPENIQNYLRDLTEVGPDKPVGYLPVETVMLCGRSVEDMQSELQQKGLQTLLFSERDCNVFSGALYVWDEIALQNHLDCHGPILEAAGWPQETTEFIHRIATKYAPSATPLFDLIADAFADKDNPWRSDKSELPPGFNLNSYRIEFLPLTLL